MCCGNSMLQFPPTVRKNLTLLINMTCKFLENIQYIAMENFDLVSCEEFDIVN